MVGQGAQVTLAGGGGQSAQVKLVGGDGQGVKAKLADVASGHCGVPILTNY